MFSCFIPPTARHTPHLSEVLIPVFNIFERFASREPHFRDFTYQPDKHFGLHVCFTRIVLPMAGLESRIRLLANRRLGAQVIAALMVTLLLLLLQSLLLRQMYRS